MKEKCFWLLPQEGTDYKANLHCHTVLSDGQLTPEQIKEAYKKEGYSIVAFTDHNKYAWHKQLDDADFMSIAALEVNVDQYPRNGQDWPEQKVYHFNFYDTRPAKREEGAAIPLPERRYGDMEYLNGYIWRMREEGFLACYNHPYWSLQDCRDYQQLMGLWAMEIYNHGCEQEGFYGYHPQAYDEMLRAGGRLCAVAADDNHDMEPIGAVLNDSFGGYVVIRAPKLEYGAIMQALEKGYFYFSMGPRIEEAYIRDGKLVVRTSPVKKIYVRQKGRDCYRKAAGRGEQITEAQFDLTGKEGYVRVDICDENGRHAGTNALWLDEVLADMWR